MAVKETPFLLEDVDAANGYYHLEKISAALILHHGTADASVPFEWSLQLNNRLNALGKDSRLHLYKDNDHELSLNDQKTLAIERDVTFFNQHTWKGN